MRLRVTGEVGPGTPAYSSIQPHLSPGLEEGFCLRLFSRPNAGVDLSNGYRRAVGGHATAFQHSRCLHNPCPATQDLDDDVRIVQDTNQSMF
jgi:hypothetical protein